jgi:hypothetical protein
VLGQAVPPRHADLLADRGFAVHPASGSRGKGRSRRLWPPLSATAARLRVLSWSGHGCSNAGTRRDGSDGRGADDAAASHYSPRLRRSRVR